MPETRTDTDKLREDFCTVVRDRKDNGYWSDSDEAEVASLIKAAIAGANQDAGLLQCWADWLASEAETIRRWRAHVREVEARMRAAAERKAA